MTVTEISRLFFADGWLQALAEGMVKTLGISLGAFVLGLSIGLIVAMVKLKGPRWMVVCANWYTTLYRAVPELLLILLLYYAGTDLLNMAMADAYIAGWDSKYHHNFWRPVTAIRNGDVDGHER